MARAGIIVPTLGNRDSLWPLLRSIAVDTSVVVVWTGPRPQDDERPADGLRWPFWGALRERHGLMGRHITFLVDHGPIDIHRWWMRGAEIAGAAGAVNLVFVNDDVRAGFGELERLANHLDTPGVRLAYLDRPEHAAVRVTPITGWCFATRVQTLIAPQAAVHYEDDTECCIHPRQLRWWYGDHAVELQATRFGADPHAVEAVEGLDIEHLRVGWAYDRQDEVSPLIGRDKVIWEQRWLPRMEEGRQ